MQEQPIDSKSKPKETPPQTKPFDGSSNDPSDNHELTEDEERIAKEAALYALNEEKRSQ